MLACVSSLVSRTAVCWQPNFAEIGIPWGQGHQAMACCAGGCKSIRLKTTTYIHTVVLFAGGPAKGPDGCGRTSTACRGHRSPARQAAAGNTGTWGRGGVGHACGPHEEVLKP